MSKGELARGWSIRPLGELVQIVSGSTPKTTEPAYWNGDIPWLTPQDLSGHAQKYVSAGDRLITQAGYESCSTRLVPRGTVLFTTRAPIGYAAIAANPICTNQGFKNFICGPEIKPDYLYWYLKGSKALAESFASGTTFLELSAKAVGRLPVPICPIEHQDLIVEEIEKQFTRLDAAVASLRRTLANLKRYRLSVLLFAVTGRLFATVSNRKGSLISFARNPHGFLAEGLPDGWRVATFAEVAKRVTVGHVGPMKHEYVAEGIPFLRSQNVRENRFDASGLKYITHEFHQKLRKSALSPGDIVVVRSGAVGTACVIPPTLAIANCADLVIIQRPTEILPEFGAYYMNSLARAAVRAGQVGVALIHFNTKSVANLPVPVPPCDEQAAIVAEVERRLSVLDELEAQTSAWLRRAERLRQSILSRAFQNRLVRHPPPEVSVIP